MPISAALYKKIVDNDPTITDLNLTNNQIGDEGVIALAANTTITTLNLYHNQIGDEGVKALAANTTITTLNLGFNRIGVEGAKALAANTTITKLGLSRNQIGDEGAEALAANTTITSLYLNWNHIGDEGVEAFAANTTITYLSLSCNPIGIDGYKAIVEAVVDKHSKIDISNFSLYLLRSIMSPWTPIRHYYFDLDDQKLIILLMLANRFDQNSILFLIPRELLFLVFNFAFEFPLVNAESKRRRLN